jgi:ubiquinone/menaquinone biosynthesis C-methylase UbiE
MPKLTTRPIDTLGELIEHFDAIAPAYHDTHGRPDRLLHYRLSIVERLLGDARRGTLLEIGCGTGIHIIALADTFERAWGTDISPEMVRRAERQAATASASARIAVRVDPAERLGTVVDGSVDVVLCIGALEHMLDRPGVLAQVRRVLAPDGRFVCLTPNGDYCWYSSIAPRLAIDTRHLSTDRFLTLAELTEIVEHAGLAIERHEHWRFIPKGDLPAACAIALEGLDALGRIARRGGLRGGLAILCRRR